MIIDIFLVLQSTKDVANTTSRVILGLVFGLKGADGHTGECRRWTKLNEMFELVIAQRTSLEFRSNTLGMQIGKIIAQQGPRQASVVAQGRPNTLHPIFEGHSI